MAACVEQGPKFALLDQVEVRASDESGEAGEAGRRGVVLQIRRYHDGTYRYGLGYFTDGELGGLYPEEWLRATGMRHPTEGLNVSSEMAPSSSIRVTESGTIVGAEAYVVIGEVLHEPPWPLR